ncbi:pentatricopeptide repeat-containing protein At4g02750-like [Aristolochia californica]|uniref:pentatricopeptide repeat-containing protein At4g02750-like n=1 Tax=Aristolochia californica TaxID=171875 RepID=UPI0035D7A62F
MYAKCGHLNLARNVFENSARDEVSYNILVVCYSQSEHCYESLCLFHQMELAGLKYDVVSFMGILSACANLNAIKQGKEIHAYLIRKAFHCHLFVANSVLDMYIKCGQIENGKLIFDRMMNRDVASWNTMILGYGMQGELETAVNLFDKMKVEGMDYDHVSYLAALSACSHGGMIERGKRYYGQMICQNIEPSQMHFACMVDLLGRAGLMEEAADFIRGLPIKPDANVWGALLGASKMHENLEMGRWAAEHLFELKPEHCGYYILLSNMYAEAGKWDEANSVRELLKSRGIRKDPAYSWIETSDKTFYSRVEERVASSSVLWSSI